MRFISKFILSAALATMAGGSAVAETVDNAAVLKMLSKGYSTQVIIGYIENADEYAFSTDMDAIDALIEAGADNEIITYMQQKVKKAKTLRHGMYWLNPGAAPEQIHLTALSKESNRIGGQVLGAVTAIAGTAVGINTGSIAPAAGSWIAGTVLSSADFKSDKLAIKGEHARVKMTERNPTFRFVLPSAQEYTATPANLWYYTWMSGIQSPSEFQLIKLKTKGKDKKAKRVFPAGLSWSAAGFSTSKESDMASLVQFDIKQVNDTTFDITIPDGLEPGEYVFFYRNALADGIKDHLSAFDFSILE